jgi:Fur family iron response transcriptional regulator
MRPYAEALQHLKTAGMRPTRQRLALARLLFSGSENRHVTAEDVHAEAQKSGTPVSLATVYNTLNQFTEAGLLREIVVEPGRTYFDTNTNDHHHFYFERCGRLHDVPAEALTLAKLPDLPCGTELCRVDVVIRVKECPEG